MLLTALAAGSFFCGRDSFVEVKFEMPNQKVLSEKQAIVASLTEKLKNASAGVLVNYSGTTVATDTELRRKLREANVEYAVVKNTLLRFAVNAVGFEALDEHLNGTTAIAISAGDPIAPCRILNEYASKKDATIQFKAGFMEGKILPNDELAQIAELPSKDALYAKVLGTMLAPITSLAVVLGQILEQKGGSTEAAAE